MVGERCCRFGVRGLQDSATLRNPRSCLGRATASPEKGLPELVGQPDCRPPEDRFWPFRRIGLHRAKELAFFADIINAAEAESIGLVNRVVPDVEIDAFVDNWAQRLAQGPPIALAMTKRLLNNSMNVTLEEALDDEGLSQTVNFSTKDTGEAMKAFTEKRDPQFKGN